MGRFSRNEFASLCHTTPAIVAVNIKRGKIVLEEDEEGTYIDSQNKLNKQFFNRYQAKFEKEQREQKSLSTQPNPAKLSAKKSTKPIKKSPPRNKEEGKETAPDFLRAFNLDLRKKEADTLLQERKAEKEKLTLEKLAGKLLPIDLTIKILQIHNRDIFATFQNDVENLASIYCDILAGGNRKKLAELTDKLSEKLSDSVKRAEEVAQASIDAAIEQYRETRSRGERK